MVQSKFDFAKNLDCVVYQKFNVQRPNEREAVSLGFVPP